MSDSETSDTNVRVAVRCRPFNTKERNAAEKSCVRISKGQVVLSNPIGVEEHAFAFDIVFDENTEQHVPWENIGVPTLEKAFKGYNGTIFAYGQTGSGKTWSMQGGDGDNQGIIPRMSRSLFDKIGVEKSVRPSVLFLVMVSYFEIYNEVINDLLSKTRQKGGLEIKEHPVLGVYIKGLQEMVVDDAQKMQAIIDQGMSCRTVASTQMNADSSRSHSVFTITVHQKDAEDESKNMFAKINLVDLAGSERVKSTGATGATLKEGANINKSLSELGNVINALVEQAKGKKNVFIPYRNSKLTRVLQESLGGNSITVMLAALSPAACNFEETLSTLKYANRAKAIKVNAVKNDESSQVSRLNDEIKMLKEKLMNQPATVTAQDTSVLEEKHRTQLKELEEAMKSTWEEKMRISREHEVERKRLESEQNLAAQQLLQQKERHWIVLEEKSDLDLSISHIRDVLRKTTPEFPGQPANHLLANDWALSYKEIMRLERLLGEQDTVVEVYRSSIIKDIDSLFRKSVGVGGLIGVIEKSAVSTWKAFRDKILAISTEVENWINLQDKLMKEMGELIKNLKVSSSKWSASTKGHSVEHIEIDADIDRGLKLILNQTELKYGKAQTNILDSRIKLSGLNDVIGNILSMLSNCESFIAKLSLDSPQVPQDELGSLIVSGITEINSFQALNIELSPNFANVSTPISVDRPLDKAQYRLQEGGVPLTASAPLSDVAATIDSSYCWTCPSETPGEAVRLASQCAEGEKFVLPSGHIGPFLQISLSKPYPVVALQFQGGRYETPKMATNVVPENRNRNSKMTSLDVGSICLPCGINASSCDGELETTKSALADIIDWNTLLKKNAPEKFLKRPPVRFIYDVLTCINSSTGFLPERISEVQWDAIANGKQEKIDFMESVLIFVSSYLGVEQVTTATAILTGSEPERTNRLLQQLAVCAYHYQSESKNELSLKTTSSYSYINKAVLAFSEDGDSYKYGRVYSTELTGNSQQISTVKMSSLSESEVLSIMSIRIFPVSWQFNPCLRVGIVVRSTDNPILFNSIDLTPQATYVRQLLAVISQSTAVILNAMNCIIKNEDSVKLKKQEEVRKKMELLAQEKEALELTLASEKQTLETQKEDLSDQLRHAIGQLNEMCKMFENEQAMRVQLESNLANLETEKLAMQTSLQEQVDEGTESKSQLLKLQANYEKDKLLIELLNKQVEEQEDTILELKESSDAQILRAQNWEAEKEDLNSQILVLLEERDTARTAEEDLFTRLREREDEFEALQESYVNMTDRFNDSQDEVSDLREQLQSLRETKDAVSFESTAINKKIEYQEVVLLNGSNSLPTVSPALSRTENGAENNIHPPIPILNRQVIIKEENGILNSSRRGDEELDYDCDFEEDD